MPSYPPHHPESIWQETQENILQKYRELGADDKIRSCFDQIRAAAEANALAETTPNPVTSNLAQIIPTFTKEEIVAHNCLTLCYRFEEAIDEYGHNGITAFTSIDLEKVTARHHALITATQPNRPAATLAELASDVGAFLDFQLANQDDLIATGLPAKWFPESNFLFFTLGRLYDTRIADYLLPPLPNCDEPRVAGHPANPVAPYSFLRHYELERKEVPNRSAASVQSGSDRLVPSWGNLTVADADPATIAVDRVPMTDAWRTILSAGAEHPVQFATCLYDKADVYPFLTHPDALRLEGLREKLFGVRVRILALLQTGIGSAKAIDPAAIVLPIVEALTDNDVRFLSDCDRRYSSSTASASAFPSGLPWVQPGGINSLIHVAAFVSAESRVGAWDEACKLAGYVVGWDRNRAALSPNHYCGLSKFEYVSQWISLGSVDRRRGFDGLLDRLILSFAEAEESRNVFRRRVGNEFFQRCHTRVVFEIPRSTRSIIEELVSRGTQKALDVISAEIENIAQHVEERDGPLPGKRWKHGLDVFTMPQKTWSVANLLYQRLGNEVGHEELRNAFWDGKPTKPDTIPKQGRNVTAIMKKHHVPLMVLGGTEAMTMIVT